MVTEAERRARPDPSFLEASVSDLLENAAEALRQQETALQTEVGGHHQNPRILDLIKRQMQEKVTSEANAKAQRNLRKRLAALRQEKEALVAEGERLEASQI